VVDPEKPAAIAAADEKSSLDLMANLTFVFGLFGLEAVTLYSIWDRAGSVLLAASAIAIAYVCYRVTVTRVLSWIDAINTVVVLYRDELLKEIGARDVLDEAGQKRVLSDLSAFVLFNSATKPIFEAEVAGPELVCSANVSADLQDAVVECASRSRTQPRGAAVDQVRPRRDAQAGRLGPRVRADPPGRAATRAHARPARGHGCGRHGDGHPGKRCRSGRRASLADR